MAKLTRTQLAKVKAGREISVKSVYDADRIKSAIEDTFEGAEVKLWDHVEVVTGKTSIKIVTKLN